MREAVTLSEEEGIKLSVKFAVVKPFLSTISIMSWITRREKLTGMPK